MSVGRLGGSTAEAGGGGAVADEALASGSGFAWRRPVVEGLQTSATAPLDAALTYLRLRGARVLPGLVLAEGPLAVVLLGLIDAVSAYRRDALAGWSAAVVGALVWRWVVLGWVQRSVLADVKDEPAMPWRAAARSVGVGVLLRLTAANAALWLGVLFVPYVWGLVLGTLVTPALLDRRVGEDGLVRTPAWLVVRGSSRAVMRSLGRSSRLVMTHTVLVLLLVATVALTQALLVGTVLPSFLGVQTGDLKLTTGSWSWRLALAVVVFVVSDAWWAVVGVMLVFDVQARQRGTDLAARLRHLKGAA